MRRRQRRGASAVEFAFIAPVLFMVLIGIFEFARLLFTWQMLHNASREGARYAVVSIETANTSQVQTYVDNYLAGQGASAFVTFSTSSNIKVYQADAAGAANSNNWTDSGWGDFVGVSVSGTYKPVVPGLLYLTGSLTLTGSCVMTAELN